MGRRSSVCRLAAQVICSLSAGEFSPSRVWCVLSAQFPSIEVWFLRIFSVRPERTLSIHVYIDRGFRRMLRRIFTRLVRVHLANPTVQTFVVACRLGSYHEKRLREQLAIKIWVCTYTPSASIIGSALQSCLANFSHNRLYRPNSDKRNGPQEVLGCGRNEVSLSGKRLSISVSAQISWQIRPFTNF